MDALGSFSTYATQAIANGSSTVTPKLPSNANVAQARKAAQDFEAVFVSQMLGHMFDGIKTDGMFGGGAGEDMFKSMMVDSYSKQIVKHGGFGIADMVMKTMLAEQEKRQ